MCSQVSAGVYDATAYLTNFRAVLVGYRCLIVAFFDKGRYVGADGDPSGRDCHLGVQFNWQGGHELAFLYPRYAKRDATCCPTLDPDLVRFRLRDGRVQRID